MHGVMQASPLVARTVRLDVRRRPVSIFDAFPPALIRVALLGTARSENAPGARSERRLARMSGERVAGNRTVLVRASYPPCAVL
jgi:hypothetical protein